MFVSRERQRMENREKTKWEIYECLITMHMDAHIMLKPLQLKGALLDRNHAILYKKQWSSHEYYNWRSHYLQIRTEKDRNNNHSHVNGLMATGESRLDMDCTPAMNPCTFPFNEYSIQGDKVIVLRMKLNQVSFIRLLETWKLKVHEIDIWFPLLTWSDELDAFEIIA